MKLEFRIAQRKENTKLKYPIATTDVKVKLSGNIDLVNEIHNLITEKVVKENRIMY